MAGGDGKQSEPLRNNTGDQALSLSESALSSRPLVDLFFKLPAVPLAIGHILAGLGRIVQPSAKTLKANNSGRAKTFFLLNWPSLVFSMIIVGTTWVDIRTIRASYRGVVSNELGKDEKDVTISELLHSKNTVICETKKNYLRVIIPRILALVPSFITPTRHTFARTSLSSGIMAADAEIRRDKPTTLEAINTIGIKQKDKPFDRIQADEILNILIMHKEWVYKKQKMTYTPPLHKSEEENQELILASFIARALNESQEMADKQPGKKIHTGYLGYKTLIYLIGDEVEGTQKSYVEQTFPINIAYVQLTRDDIAGLHKVKEAAHAIATGVAEGKNELEVADAVFRRYGIEMYNLVRDEEANMGIRENTDAISVQPQGPTTGSTTNSLLPQSQLNHAQYAGIKSASPHYFVTN